MKHIVFVIGNYKNGGVAMRSTNLANALDEKGYKVTLLVTKDISEDVFFKKYENVQVISLSHYIKAHKEDVNVLKYQKKLTNTISFIKWLRYITHFFSEVDSVLAEKVRNIRKSRDLSIFAVNHRECVYIPFGIGCYEKTFFAVAGCRNEFETSPFKRKKKLELLDEIAMDKVVQKALPNIDANKLNGYYKAIYEGLKGGSGTSVYKSYKKYFFYINKYKPFARKMMSNKLVEKIYSFIK